MAAKKSHRRNPSSSLSVRKVGLAATGAGSAVYLAGLGWPAAVLGSVLIVAVMWTISDLNRTRHLATLIRAIRSGLDGEDDGPGEESESVSSNEPLS